MRKIHLILLSIFFSFLISNFLIKSVFLGQTPKIRSDFLAKIKIISPKMENETARPHFSSFTVKTPAKIEEMVKNASFKKISKGVYAGETENKLRIYSYHLSEIEWQVIEYTLESGKKVFIKIPKGMAPPEKEEIKMVFGEK